MAETKVSKKNKDNIQEKDTKVKSKSKKTKVKEIEPLDSKVSQVAEPLDDVKVDVEIDCRSSQPCVYIRRKRSI